MDRDSDSDKLSNWEFEERNLTPSGPINVGESLGGMESAKIEGQE